MNSYYKCNACAGLCKVEMMNGSDPPTMCLLSVQIPPAKWRPTSNELSLEDKDAALLIGEYKSELTALQIKYNKLASKYVNKLRQLSAV